MSGPAAVCRHCGGFGRGEAYFSSVEGWLCKTCMLKSRTILETRTIDGIRYTRILKSPPKAKPAAAVQAEAGL